MKVQVKLKKKVQVKLKKKVQVKLKKKVQVKLEDGRLKCKFSQQSSTNLDESILDSIHNSDETKTFLKDEISAEIIDINKLKNDELNSFELTYKLKLIENINKISDQDLEDLFLKKFSQTKILVQLVAADLASGSDEDKENKINELKTKFEQNFDGEFSKEKYTELVDFETQFINEIGEDTITRVNNNTPINREFIPSQKQIDDNILIISKYFVNKLNLNIKNVVTNFKKEDEFYIIKVTISNNAISEDKISTTVTPESLRNLFNSEESKNKILELVPDSVPENFSVIIKTSGLEQGVEFEINNKLEELDISRLSQTQIDEIIDKLKDYYAAKLGLSNEKERIEINLISGSIIINIKIYAQKLNHHHLIQVLTHHQMR